MITLLFRVFSVPQRRHVLILLGSAIAVVLVGAELFALAESLPFTTGLYWAVTTATTVGYGDVTPHNPIGKLIASLVMLTTIPMLAAAFAIVSGAAAAASVRKQAPALVITALVDSPSVREALRDLGVQQSVATSELVARTLAASLETPHAGEMISALVGSRDVLAEVDPGTSVGKRLSAVRNERPGLVLGLVRDGEFTLGLGDDPVVAAGDRLLVAEATGHA